jgi:ABC-2 type transport system permease protein
MMRVLALALKDLTEVVRDRKSAIFLVLMPVIFTLFFGFAFRFADPDPRLPVGLRDADGGTLAASLAGLLAASDAVRVVPVEPGDGGASDDAAVDAMVRKGTVAAAVVVPPGFTARTLAGEVVPLTLVAPNSPAGQTASTAIQSAGKRLLGALESAHLAAQFAEEQQPFADAAARAAFLEQASVAAGDAWQEPDLAVLLQGAGVPTSTPKVAQGFAQSSPGMLVMFSVFSLITSAMVLAVERRSGTLQRMLTAPIGRAEIIAGHVLAMFLLVFGQELLLVLLGQFAFGVNYGAAPLATLLMMAVLALWAASLGLLIGASVRREEQVVMYALVAMFVFSALGGAWFPLAIAGKTFSAIGHVLPTAWAMDGFQNIVLRAQGAAGVLLPAAIVGAYALLFYALALWRFRFE